MMISNLIQNTMIDNLSNFRKIFLVTYIWEREGQRFLCLTEEFYSNFFNIPVVTLLPGMPCLSARTIRKRAQ